jgi:hypothetical protein
MSDNDARVCTFGVSCEDWCNRSISCTTVILIREKESGRQACRSSPEIASGIYWCIVLRCTNKVFGDGNFREGASLT